MEKSTDWLTMIVVIGLIVAVVATFVQLIIKSYKTEKQNPKS